MIKAASSCKYMTKRIVMGMFALSSAEANTLPRKVLPIYGGIMYQYDPQVATDAVDKAGGDGWNTKETEKAFIGTGID